MKQYKVNIKEKMTEANKRKELLELALKVRRITLNYKAIFQYEFGSKYKNHKNLASLINTMNRGCYNEEIYIDMKFVVERFISLHGDELFAPKLVKSRLRNKNNELLY